MKSAKVHFPLKEKANSLFCILLSTKFLNFLKKTTNNAYANSFKYKHNLVTKF